MAQLQSYDPVEKYVVSLAFFEMVVRLKCRWSKKKRTKLFELFFGKSKQGRTRKLFHGGYFYFPLCLFCPNLQNNNKFFALLLYNTKFCPSIWMIRAFKTWEVSSACLPHINMRNGDYFEYDNTLFGLVLLFSYILHSMLKITNGAFGRWCSTHR